MKLVVLGYTRNAKNNNEGKSRVYRSERVTAKRRNWSGKSWLLILIVYVKNKDND